MALNGMGLEPGFGDWSWDLPESCQILRTMAINGLGWSQVSRMDDSRLQIDQTADYGLKWHGIGAGIR